MKLEELKRICKFAIESKKNNEVEVLVEINAVVLLRLVNGLLAAEKAYEVTVDEDLGDGDGIYINYNDLVELHEAFDELERPLG